MTSHPKYGSRAARVFEMLHDERRRNGGHLADTPLQRLWSEIVHASMGELRNVFDANYNDPREALPDDAVDAMAARHGVTI